MKFYQIKHKEVKAELPKGMSYGFLSTLTGIDRSYLHKIVNNKLEVSEDTANKILRALNAFKTQ